MFSWVLWILEFFSVNFDSMVLGQLENTIFHHYSSQIHVILSNLPLKVQNKCQIFSISFYHSKCVAQSLQKPLRSNSPSVWVSVLKANPLLEQIQSLTFSTFSLALCTSSWASSLPFLNLCANQKQKQKKKKPLPLYSPSNTIIVPLDVLCHLCLLNFMQNLVLILGFLQLLPPIPIQYSL